MRRERHLILGVAGYLGVGLARRLRALGADVVGFDLAADPDLPAGVRHLRGDVRDAEDVVAAARGCDVVHHLVGIMPQARARPEVMHAVNVGGTRNALEAARRCGARRLLFVSSSEVYGIPRAVPIGEDHPKNPIGEYGRNKVEAERLCAEYARAGHVETVVLRPSTLVGPAVRERLVLALLDRAARGKALVVPRPGANRFQMTAVEDCVEALILAADAPGASGEAFNLGAPDTLPVRDELRELVRAAGIRSRVYPIPVALLRTALRILDAIGRSPLERDHYLLMDRDLVMDCAKAERLLGWRARQTNLAMLRAAFAARVQP